MSTIGALTPRTLANSTWTGRFPRTQSTFATPSVVVPVGALDHWFAFRRTKGAARGEILGFGDSTMHGAGGPPPYSWMQRLRDRAVGYGFADGGKGCFAGLEQEIVYDSPEVNGIVTDNFAGSTDSNDLYGGGVRYDDGTVANRTLTMQFRGTCARLWYTSRPTAGEFTYTVDGGAAVTVDAKGLNGQQPRFVYISGLSFGLHTVVVTNLASRTANPPASITAGVFGTGGTITAGTYFYKVTNVFGGGETLPSASISAVVGTGQKVLVTVPNDGQDSILLYRSTTVGGTYQLVTMATFGTQAGSPTATDSGGALGANAPTSGTTNRNLTGKECWIAFAGMNDTGYTNQKYAITGQIMGNFNVTWSYWPAFGLTSPSGSRTDPASYSVDTTLPAAGRVKPVLAMIELGFNDLTSDATNAATKAVTMVQIFAACCKAAGCDGVVVSGQLPFNANWGTNGAALFNALKSEALNQGLVWVDLFTPVGGPSLSYAGAGGSPHLPKAQYVAQADWLWDNLLAVN